jgi:Xaa-Pro aminopeptidase
MQRTIDALADLGAAAALITPGPSLRYLTGYDAVALERLTCLILQPEREAVLVVPALEYPAAVAAGVEQLDLTLVIWQEQDDPVALVIDLLPAGAVVAVDDHMPAAKVLAFAEGLRAMPVLVGPALAGLQVIKSVNEIQELVAAGAAIDRVHGRMQEWLRPGRTEAQIGRDIAEAILGEGHARVDFVIVASGPNSASPHHAVSDRVVQVGEPVVVDIGGTTASGYCSDETRTYWVGATDSTFVAHYAALERAQQAAFDAARIGATAESVDTAAREVLADEGLGEWFVHRTGHGIGLSTHEEPYIVQGNTEPLREGMAFSIEPGFYIPGQWGARLEDIVVMTDAGAQRVNHCPRGLTVL